MRCGEETSAKGLARRRVGLKLAAMKVAVFHPGTQHSWQTALALQDLGLLEWYATSIFYQPDRFPYVLEKVLPGCLAEGLHREFRRFSHPGLDPRLVRAAGLTEWIERLATRLGWHRAARDIDLWGNRRFVRQIGQSIRSPAPFALWGYNGSSRTTFELARAHGRPCILDRTIADFRTFNRIMADLANRYPDWVLPVDREYPASAIADDDREYELADIILVGSDFVARSVREEARDPAVADKVRLIEYCYDEAMFGAQLPPAPVPAGGPVRFLFLGAVSPRKGIHHVLEAITRFPRDQAELTVVGGLRTPPQTFGRHADRITYLPSVARADVPAIMAAHHVLLFPSYFEGSALCLLEGLASGLALIQTRAAGLGVTPQTGVLLDEPDTDALHAAMARAVAERDMLNFWRSNAQQEARRYSFAKYRAKIARLLAELGIQARTRA